MHKDRSWTERKVAESGKEGKRAPSLCPGRTPLTPFPTAVKRASTCLPRAIKGEEEYPECKNTKPLDASGAVKKEKEEPEKTDLKCELCGGDIVIRKSRYGRFYACSNFPKCKYTKPIREEIGVSCPKCGAPVVRGFGKNHAVFYSCSNYPKCDFSVWDMPTEKNCPVCGARLLVKKGKGYLYCMNKDCYYKEEAPETKETS